MADCTSHSRRRIRPRRCRSNTRARCLISSSRASPWSPRAGSEATGSSTLGRCSRSARRASPPSRIPRDWRIPPPDSRAASRPERPGACGAEAGVDSCARSAAPAQPRRGHPGRCALPRVLVVSLAPADHAAISAAGPGVVILGYLGAGVLLAGLVLAGFSALLSFWAGAGGDAVFIAVGRRAFYAAASMAVLAGVVLEVALL